MSLEELFLKQLCICGHSLDEHEERCYALDFNGSIYSACDCRKLRIMPLIFTVKLNEVSNNTSNETNSKSTGESIKSSTIFQWKKKNLNSGREASSII